MAGRKNSRMFQEMEPRGRDAERTGRKTEFKDRDAERTGRKAEFKGRDAERTGRKAEFTSRGAERTGGKAEFKGRDAERTGRKAEFKGTNTEIDDGATALELINAEETGRLEGKNTILEALKANRPMNRIYLEKDSKDQVIGKIFAIARKQDVVVSFIERGKLDQMSQTRSHQGVIADVAPHAYVEVQDILKRAQELQQPPFIIILDGITDPNNLGSIIRSAECAGVHGIILPKRRSAGLTPVVAKVAAGAAEHIPIARVTNIKRTMDELKEAGVWIIGTGIQGETVYDRYDFQEPVAIVIGSEGEGMSRLVSESCDILLKIPMYGEINSLNAAVACALIVFKAAGKREEAGLMKAKGFHG